MSGKPIDAEALRMLQHDIKNQLSNIHLALENLRYEIANPTDDANFFMDTIFVSAAKINDLLKETE
jgi:nitrogen fixation/metabolism regulation signal transduction histidine kinase